MKQKQHTLYFHIEGAGHTVRGQTHMNGRLVLCGSWVLSGPADAPGARGV